MLPIRSNADESEETELARPQEPLRMDDDVDAVRLFVNRARRLSAFACCFRRVASKSRRILLDVSNLQA